MLAMTNPLKIELRIAGTGPRTVRCVVSGSVRGVELHGESTTVYVGLDTVNHQLATDVTRVFRGDSKMVTVHQHDLAVRAVLAALQIHEAEMEKNPHYLSE